MQDEHLKTAAIGGLILGLLIAGWAYVMAATGWYKDPDLFQAIWFMLISQAVVIGAVLYRTRIGSTYRSQFSYGLIVSAVASVPAFIAGLLVTGVFFPDYFADLREAREVSLIADGVGQEAINEILERLAPSQSPGGQAFSSFMGTLATGMIISLVAALVLRKPALHEPAA